MRQHVLNTGQKDVLLFETGAPKALLIQTLGRHERKTIEREVELICQMTDVPFMMAAFDIADWDRELTPWPDHEVSKRKTVGYGAGETLRYVIEELLPNLPPLPVILGGYSLGGLFSLWASTQTDRFTAIAACSPSLWICNWLAFAEATPTRTKSVYLSLGDREELSKNKAISHVGDCVRSEYELLKSTLGPDHCTLYWEQGNHFVDGDGRMARGFAWCMNKENSEQ